MLQHVSELPFLRLKSILCTEHILFLRTSVAGHLGGFQLLATVNNSPVKMGVQIPVFSSLGWNCTTSFLYSHAVTTHKLLHFLKQDLQ